MKLINQPRHNMSQLFKTTSDGVTQTWQYDANGNRTHEDGVQVASYDTQDRLTQYKDNTYQYNALGQLTQKTTPGGTETYEYDVFGNLRSVTLANGVNIEYLIDPKGRRIGKKVNGVIKQKLLYINQLNPIAELYPDNSVKNLFIYADKSNVPSAMERYDYRGNLLGKFRIISNHLGSVVMVINAESGDIAQEIEYDVWGNVLSDSNPNFQPFYFAGGIYDTDTKLTRFGARDYDAETGRWTAKDPILFGGGLTSLYDYVGGDPVNYLDISGLAPMGMWYRMAQPTRSIADYYPHNTRNSANNPPATETEAIQKNYQKLSDNKSVFHQQGYWAKNNSKYISPDGHVEGVYRPDGTLDTSPLNQGTYNYFSPNDLFAHFTIDVVPYYIYGNGPNDPSSVWDRILAPIPGYSYDRKTDGLMCYP